MARKLTEPALVGNKPFKARSHVRISGPKARRIMDGIGVGKKHTFKIHGKIAGVSSNEFDDSIDMDLEHCEDCIGEAPRSLTHAMKRKRHMASGRFTS